MNLLILGGTGFLGPHTVREALKRGHKMTLFNRGRTRQGLFPNLVNLRGDRNPNKGDGLSALKGKQWDAVIDTSGYIPKFVRASNLPVKGKKEYLVLDICKNLNTSKYLANQGSKQYLENDRQIFENEYKCNNERSE